MKGSNRTRENTGPPAGGAAEEITDVVAGSVLEPLEARLLLTGDPLAAPQVVDDGDAGFSVSGSWAVVSTAGHEGDQRVDAVGLGTASWVFTGLAPGYRYRVWATWTPGLDRTQHAIYRITNHIDYETQRELASLNVDQTLACDDLDEAGTLWEALGDPYLVRGTTLSVQLSGMADGALVADAIRIERVGTWVAPIGIPTPEFGIEETHWMYAAEGHTFDYGDGPEAYHMGDNGPYTHYVDNTHPSATDSSNPLGTPEQPRLTVPLSLHAGTVVEIHGGPYTYTIGGVLQITGTGTLGRPIFVRAAHSEDRPVIRSRILVAGEYIVVENLELDGNGQPTYGARVVMLPPSHHLAIRNLEIHNVLGGPTAGVSITSYDSDNPDSIHDIVVSNSVIHDLGDLLSQVDEDHHGISIGVRARSIWVIDNEVCRTSGSGIVVNAGFGYQEATHHIYIGRNTCHSTRQAGFGLKQCTDVIISQNVAHDIISTGWSVSKGIGFQYESMRLWLLHNEIYDCELGIISGGGTTQDVYIIGNLLRDIHSGAPDQENPDSLWGKGWGITMRDDSLTMRHIYFNTMYNVDAGISSVRAIPLSIVGNIVANVGAGYDIAINSAQASGSSQVRNCLLDAGARIYWHWTSLDGIDEFAGLFADQTSGCIDEPPGFLDPDRGDFRLQTAPGMESPAIDAGSDAWETYVQTFWNLYGVDIGVDFDGKPRPQGDGPDIGAFETQGDEPVDPEPGERRIYLNERGQLAYVDADGDRVIVTLKGPGAGALFFASDGPADVGRIVLSGTTSASTLTVKTVGRGTETTIGQIRVNGSLKAITAKTSDLLGELTVTGTLGRLAMDDASGAAIEVNTSGGKVRPRAQLAASFDRVADSSLTTHGVAIRSMTATEWLDTDATDDEITAPAIRRLQIRGDAKRGRAGDFQASLDLNASGQRLAVFGFPGLGGARTNLGSAKIAGDISGETWSIVGEAGVVQVLGAVSGWVLDVQGGLRGLKLADVTSAAVDVSGAVGTVKAARWTSGSLGADRLRQLKVVGNRRLGLAGDFGADLTLADSSGPLPLRTAHVAGSLINSTWSIAGSIGTLTVVGTADGSEVRAAGGVRALTLGATVGSDFLAGANESVGRFANTDSDFANRHATIRSLRITGLRAAADPKPRYFHSDSNFSAASFGNVALMNVDFGSQTTGLYALSHAHGGGIGHVTCNDTVTGERWEWSSASDQPHEFIDML